MEAGARQAGKDLGVRINWKGPLLENDRAQQIAIVEQFIAGKVSGIVLAPLDKRALVRPVEEAKQAGVPTVIIDSGLDSDSIVSFVATDNVKGGQLAADRLGELLGGQREALLLRYQEGSASTMERERGFLFDFRESAPGPLVATTDEVVTELRDLDLLRHTHAADYAEFRARFHAGQDGHAADRAVAAFFGS